MKDLKPSGLTREQWSAMTLYEKFEQVVIFVLSAIIAVIGVDERSVPCGCESLLYGGLAGRQGIKPEVGIGQAPSAEPCLKAVEMLVLPAHGRLKNKVQTVQAQIRRHHEGPRDAGRDVFQNGGESENAHKLAHLQGSSSSILVIL